jgi:hypothetical protein
VSSPLITILDLTFSIISAIKAGAIPNLELTDI